VQVGENKQFADLSLNVSSQLKDQIRLVGKLKPKYFVHYKLARRQVIHHVLGLRRVRNKYVDV